MDPSAPTVNDRFFSPQPNVPGRGIVASYDIAFWTLVVATGLFAGLAGAALMELLRLVEHLAWSYHSGSLLAGVERVSSARRVLVLLAAGAITGAGVLALGRLRGIGGGEISEAVWLGDGRLSLPRSIARGLLSIVIVGMGASIGREAAPQLAGAGFASRICQYAGVPAWQRRLLVACGAGAGMAAVYNVPLGGALFAVEVLLGTLSLPLVLPALATATIATAVSWIALPDAPTYRIPTYTVSASLVVWAVLVGPLAGLAAAAWVRLVVAAHRRRPERGLARMLAPVLVLTALGALAIAFPQLLGNGRDLSQVVLAGGLGVGLLAVLVVLKPIVTGACLGSGAPGGLFTPSLTYGVLFGALLGHGWALLWPQAPVGAYAVVGGAAVLAASMQGPLAALVLVLELTHFADAVMVPVLLAVVGATVVSRRLGLQSIYSARLDSGAILGAATRAAEALPPAPFDDAAAVAIGVQPAAPGDAERVAPARAARTGRAGDEPPRGAAPG